MAMQNLPLSPPNNDNMYTLIIIQVTLIYFFLKVQSGLNNTFHYYIQSFRHCLSSFVHILAQPGHSLAFKLPLGNRQDCVSVSQCQLSPIQALYSPITSLFLPLLSTIYTHT